MSVSANLALPYIQPSQSQKHVTHNEGMRRLDTLVQLSVISATQSAPPAAPSDGNRYLLPAGPTGAWVGQANSIAVYEDPAWVFYTPLPGWTAWVQDDAKAVVYDGATWAGADAVPPLQNLDMVGIQTTADTTNRFAVASAATLLTHAGAGHQLKLNKAATADTASLLFQTGFSGRAEMGTTGSDDFAIKVSDDGATFHQALIADSATGRVQFPANSFRNDGPYCTGDRRPLVTVSATWGLSNNTGGNLQRLVDGTMGNHVYSDGTDQTGKYIQFALDSAQQIVEFRCHFSTLVTGDVKTVIQATNTPAGDWLTISGPTAWADMMSSNVVTLPSHPAGAFSHYRIFALSGIASNAPWFHGINMATMG